VGDEAKDLVGGEAERHGPHHARYDAEIVKLPVCTKNLIRID